MDDVKTNDIIKPRIFNHSGLKAFFSTASFKTEIDNIAGYAGISRNNVYLPVQKHSGKIYVLESDMEPAAADAVLTERKGVLIGIRVADCVPILLYDRKKHLIGAVHAGWRGTSKQILKNTIMTMQEKFSSSAPDILIAIGPSIRKCCYIVGNEVKEEIEKVAEGDGYYSKKDGRHYIDLSSVNVLQSLSAGVPHQNIWQSDECTFCNPEKFFSYRYSNESAGRQGGFIIMM